jgi:hypothetical protein
MMMADKETFMPIQAMSSSVQRLATSDVPLRETSATDSSPLMIAGLSVVQPTREAAPYSMRWYRAWESDLYRRAVRNTGRRQWDLTRFSVDGGPDALKAGYRETQAAISQAAKQAMAVAESNCGRPGSRERLALLYFDFWGQCSHLEQAFNWRDSFDLDVIPKFLLRDHGVNGYSCKIQAGRAGFVQGLRIANDLLNGGDIDSVLLGGVFRFYPALGFSEAIVNAEQEQRWLGKGGQHSALIIERAGFVVLKRADAAVKAKAPPLMIASPQYLAISRSGEAVSQQLTHAWSALLPEACGSIYGGLYPSSGLATAEGSASAAISSHMRYENLCRRFGDSGGINPLLALQHYAERKRTTAGGDISPALLSLSDSNGATWLLRFE